MSNWKNSRKSRTRVPRRLKQTLAGTSEFSDPDVRRAESAKVIDGERGWKVTPVPAGDDVVPVVSVSVKPKK